MFPFLQATSKIIDLTMGYNTSTPMYVLLARNPVNDEFFYKQVTEMPTNIAENYLVYEDSSFNCHFYVNKKPMKEPGNGYKKVLMNATRLSSAVIEDVTRRTLHMDYLSVYITNNIAYKNKDVQLQMEVYFSEHVTTEHKFENTLAIFKREVALGKSFDSFFKDKYILVWIRFNNVDYTDLNLTPNDLNIFRNNSQTIRFYVKLKKVLLTKVTIVDRDHNPIEVHKNIKIDVTSDVDLKTQLNKAIKLKDDRYQIRLNEAITLNHFFRPEMDMEVPRQLKKITIRVFVYREKTIRWMNDQYLINNSDAVATIKEMPRQELTAKRIIEEAIRRIDNGRLNSKLCYLYDKVKGKLGDDASIAVEEEEDEKMFALYLSEQTYNVDYLVKFGRNGEVVLSDSGSYSIDMSLFEFTKKFTRNKKIIDKLRGFNNGRYSGYIKDGGIVLSVGFYVEIPGRNWENDYTLGTNFETEATISSSIVNIQSGVTLVVFFDLPENNTSSSTTYAPPSNVINAPYAEPLKYQNTDSNIYAQQTTPKKEEKMPTLTTSQKTLDLLDKLEKDAKINEPPSSSYIIKPKPKRSPSKLTTSSSNSKNLKIGDSKLEEKDSKRSSKTTSSSNAYTTNRTVEEIFKDDPFS